MKDSPPESLIELLTGLGLATAGEVRAVSGRVRRLAGGLPLFESLWIDALAQARLLTPWQAVEISAGRGRGLRMGPFVVYERLAALGYATLFRARQIDGRGFVRLTIAAEHGDLRDTERRLMLLAQKADELRQRAEINAPTKVVFRFAKERRWAERMANRESDSSTAGWFTTPLWPVAQCGLEGDRVWAASPWFAGRTARQWMLGHGRLPPQNVHEIARGMLVGLTACERAGVPHADLSVDQLWFDARGQLRLPEPGLRGALRPMEDGGASDLPAEAYDYLSPERAATGALADSRGDVYACGALWWHLLAGRPPFAGATARVKVHTIQTAKLPDIRHVAPDTPEPLAEMVMRSLAREPERRPESLAALAEALGEPSVKGQRRLAKQLRSATGRRRFRFAAGPWRRRPQTSTWVAAAIGVVLAAIIIAWPAVSPRLDELAAETPPRVALAVATNMHASPPVRLPDRVTVSAPPDAAAMRPPKTEAMSSFAPRKNALSRSERRQSAADQPLPTMPDAASGDFEAANLEGEADERVGPPDATIAPEDYEKVLNLSADDPPIDFSQLALGQTLRGDPNRRPMIEVPPEGFTVVATDVTIENIDFVARQPLDGDAAMLTLRGLKTVLRGCSFQAAADLPKDLLPAAIRWDRVAEAAEANADLATGEVQLTDVAFRRVACGTACRLTAGMVLRWENVLCLETGPAVRIDRFPAADELALLNLSRVTLRGARSLVEVGCDDFSDSIGHLEVEAVDCAFVLPAAAALLLFDGQQRPGPLLRGLRWEGQGSVLSPRSRLAIWRMPEGRMLAAADQAVPITGVVRAEVGFAGSPADSAEGSRIIRWQAPLSSPHPPGIDDAALHLPSTEP